MYTVIRHDTRPTAETAYFGRRFQAVDELFRANNITRHVDMSKDQLTRIITFRAPSQEAWDTFVNSTHFQAEYLPALNEYNAANGINYAIISKE